jgi:N-glycosylase/DNA lyase
MWHSLGVSASQLGLRATLNSGQVFHWQQHVIKGDNALHGMGTVFTGCLRENLVVSLREKEITGHHPQKLSAPAIEYCVVYNELHPEESLPALIRQYFQLSHPDWLLPSLAVDKKLTESHLSADHALTLSITDPSVSGHCIVAQDPWECMCTFILSANNNMPRIKGLVLRLCSTFGKYLCTWEGVDFHAFPSPQKLASLEEEQLRNLGAGYRSPLLIATAKRWLALEEEHEHAIKLEPGLGQEETERSATLNGKWWRPFALDSTVMDGAHLAPMQISQLQEKREEALKMLESFAGVGPKVAACIALYSLGHAHLVPVDVHMRRVSMERYGGTFWVNERPTKTLSRREITLIQDGYLTHFGLYAGWWQSVLFAGVAVPKAKEPKKTKREKDDSLQKKRKKKDAV